MEYHIHGVLKMYSPALKSYTLIPPVQSRLNFGSLYHCMTETFPNAMTGPNYGFPS